MTTQKEIDKEIAEIETQLFTLQNKKRNLIHDQQSKCEHNPVHIIEYYYNYPWGRRVCTDCGLAEDENGCGFYCIGARRYDVPKADERYASKFVKTVINSEYQDVITLSGRFTEECKNKVKRAIGEATFNRYEKGRGYVVDGVYNSYGEYIDSIRSRQY